MKLSPEPILYDGRLAHPRTDFIYTEKIDEGVVDGIIDFYNTQTIFEEMNSGFYCCAFDSFRFLSFTFFVGTSEMVSCT